MTSLEPIQVLKLDIVITYSRNRLQQMTQHDESNCKSIYKILKQMIQDHGGKITAVTSSSISSKSVGGTHLVLETGFTNTVDPITLQQYFDSNAIAGVDKVTIAV